MEMYSIKEQLTGYTKIEDIQAGYYRFATDENLEKRVFEIIEEMKKGNVKSFEIERVV